MVAFCLMVRPGSFCWLVIVSCPVRAVAQVLSRLTVNDPVTGVLAVPLLSTMTYM
jgi:hypothetical protein